MCGQWVFAIQQLDPTTTTYGPIDALVFNADLTTNTNAMTLTVNSLDKSLVDPLTGSKTITFKLSGHF